MGGCPTIVTLTGGTEADQYGRTIWGLQKCGKPYRVFGSVGTTHMTDVVAAGGNTIRTYDMDQLIGSPNVLDKAHAMGISVIVGLALQAEGVSGRFPAFTC